MPTLSDLANKLNRDFITTAFSVTSDGTGLVIGPGDIQNMTVGTLGGVFDQNQTVDTLIVDSLLYSGSTPITVEMFDGFPITVRAFALSIASSSQAGSPPTKYEIALSTAAVDVSTQGVAATLVMPDYFSGGTAVSVDMNVIPHSPDPANNPGLLDIAFAPVQSNPALVTPEGNIEITSSDLPFTAGVLSLSYELSSMHLEIRSGQRAMLFFKGKLTITTPGFPVSWPELDFMGLGIDSQGKVEMDDQWYKLPKHKALDIKPFTVDLQKIGFGTDPYGVSSSSSSSSASAPPTRHRWVGLDGSVKLSAGITISGSVKGLRLNIDDGTFSFNGIGLGLKIKDVLEIKGEVDHTYATSQDDFKNQNSSAITVPQSFTYIDSAGDSANISPYAINLFLGKLDINLKEIGIDVGAQVLIGRVEESIQNGKDKSGNTMQMTFPGMDLFFIFLDVSFPGIPLFADISLFELAGLFAFDLRPDPTQPDHNGATHTWWEWFKYPTSTSGNITTAPAIPSGPGAYTATDAAKWIYPSQGAMAFGAGAGIGTSADKGFTASASLTLVLMFPGPVVMLVGKGNVLHKRGRIGDAAPFDAMATLDFQGKSFQLALGVTVDLLEIVKIHGDAEVYVNWDSSSSNHGWYLALGKPPQEQRITARILSLFDADTYFVVSNTGLITGSYIGFSQNWDFGPLGVHLRAYIATLLALNWSPLQAGGGMEWYGEVELEAFGIGIGITVDALVEACAPNPFWIHGEFTVSLDLPWPLPSPSATVGLTWGSDDGSVPPAPLALNGISALMSDHANGSDHFSLLSHLPGAPVEPGAVVYDSQAPGLLNLDSTNQPLWTGLVGSAANTNPGDAHYDDALNDILPPLVPDTDPATTQFAAVVPADAHLVLTFAHSMVDDAGFMNPSAESTFPVDTAPGIPGNLPPDDMSHLNPNPPTPQWQFRHVLRQVAIYEYKSGSWQMLLSTPTSGAALDLPGSWMPATNSQSSSSAPNTILKVAPCSEPAGSNSPTVYALPDSPALYAIKTVTRIEARRVGDSSSPYQRVPNGDPIVEFAYFQTAGGPGLALGATPAASGLPNPYPPMISAYPLLATNANMPTTGFPAGGSLQDLKTYVQWSWPDNGQLAAYYGYDLNVEFNEDCVNFLYASLDQGSILNALRLRGEDRNHRLVYLRTLSIRPPAVKQQTAVIADGGMRYDLPSVVQTFLAQQIATAAPAGNPAPATTLGGVSPGTLQALRSALQAKASTSAAARRAIGGAASRKAAIHERKAPSPQINPLSTELSAYDKIVLGGLAARGGISLPAGASVSIYQSDSGAAAAILKELEEITAAQAVRDNWFVPFRPRTFYSLDIVAGSSDGEGNPTFASATTVGGGLQAVYQAQDPIGAWAALQAYLADEQARTSLYHFEFTTSRFSTFTEHMSAAALQDATASLNPMASNAIRRFVSAVDPQSWFTANRANYDLAKDSYISAVSTLQVLVKNFDPSGDWFASAGNGEADLIAQRAATDAAWFAFSTAASAGYDGLIAALGRPELASGQHAPLPTQSELSFFAADAAHISAILLESPEPFLWRRMWQWIALGPADARSAVVEGVLALWSGDGTRAVIIPVGQPAGSYTLTFRFKGDIGAEAPAIVRHGDPVGESVSLQPIPLAPYPWRIPGGVAGKGVGVVRSVSGSSIARKILSS
ncbi:MAG: hypothetical protein ACYDDO_13855 [Acidiferrobacterales bacterium]